MPTLVNDEAGDFRLAVVRWLTECLYLSDRVDWPRGSGSCSGMFGIIGLVEREISFHPMRIEIVVALQFRRQK